jgi:hypothetical protein
MLPIRIILNGVEIVVGTDQQRDILVGVKIGCDSDGVGVADGQRVLAFQL